ncbi:MAG: glycosyltransferase [Anaerolineae bacterium]|nr:glycosyltransferase [Anaerolineae bacterium]
MKIVVISIFKEGFGGGSGRVGHDMARHFAVEHDVVLICPADETGLFEIAPNLRILGIHSIGEKNACVPLLSRKNVNTMFDFLDKFTPDIIHAHEPVSLSLMGQVWAVMNNVPFVYTAHVLPTKTLDFGATDILKFLVTPWTESITQRMMSDFLQHCDAVIALNNAAAADIAQFGYQGQVFVIPNARDIDTLGNRQIADITSPTKILTFVGYLNQRKNQRYLLDMLQYLPRNYILQIIGDALDPDYGDQLKQWAKAKSMDNVVFTGSVPYSEIPDYLEKTHVFVSASKMEVQSLAVIEALASGTPVVALSNETVDELVNENVGGRLGPNASPETFAQRVRDICNLSAPDYEQLCTNARHRVAYLGWDRIRTETLHAYTTLLDDHTHSSVADDEISKIIARIPSEEARKFLGEKITQLNETIQNKIHPHSRLGLFSIATHTRQVSGTTWCCVGATRFISTILGGVLQLATARPFR